MCVCLGAMAPENPPCSGFLKAESSWIPERSGGRAVLRCLLWRRTSLKAWMPRSLKWSLAASVMTTWPGCSCRVQRLMWSSLRAYGPSRGGSKHICTGSASMAGSAWIRAVAACGVGRCSDGRSFRIQKFSCSMNPPTTWISTPSRGWKKRWGHSPGLWSSSLTTARLSTAWRPGSSNWIVACCAATPVTMRPICNANHRSSKQKRRGNADSTMYSRLKRSGFDGYQGAQNPQ